ncbi:arginine--tRNA ligase [Paenibacillus sp. WLX2291]|uniref:arginine--tRNA ligase n=1 Tax=Paenibacillus sp. WLX2291 TaxID=3296934 RepID=UPI00398434E4
MITTELFKQQALQVLLPLVEIEEQAIYTMLETPPSPELGDLAFPCFALAKSWRRAPQQIAAELAQRINEQLQFAHPTEHAPVQAHAAGPYINLSWNRQHIAPQLLQALADPEYAQLQIVQGQRIILDMSSPNIAKPFGVGHLRSTVIGAALHRLYTAAGYTVVRVNHIGDWGTQFGKQITAHLRWHDPVQAAADPIGEALRVYIQFHDEVKQHPELDDEARDWFRRLEQGDAEALELWHYFVKVSMASLDLMYQRLNVEFDEVLGESFYNDKMPAVVQQLQAAHLLEQSDGAQVVRLDEYDMPPCLILKSDGTTIYPTRDLATAIYRKQVMRGDRLIYVVGGEQTLHFHQVFAVLEKMGYEWAQDCTHVPFGLMKINGKKMSTRKGKVVFLEQVLDDAVQRADDIISEKNPQLPEREQVARQVGIGAVIFNDLKNYRQNEIDFAPDQAVSFEGETGPYIQYVYARIQSILRRAQEQSTAIQAVAGSSMEGESWSDAAWELLCHLGRYRQTLERAVQQHEPSVMARYALHTARLFNQFYSRDRIVDAAPSERAVRLQLTEVTGQYIKRMLHLLGMEAPNQM